MYSNEICSVIGDSKGRERECCAQFVGDARTKPSRVRFLRLWYLKSCFVFKCLKRNLGIWHISGSGTDKGRFAFPHSSQRVFVRRVHTAQKYINISCLGEWQRFAALHQATVQEIFEIWC